MLKLPLVTVSDWAVPPFRRRVAEVAPVIVPVTVADELLVSVPSDGEDIVIAGLFGLTSTVTVPDTPVLPTPSTALTDTVLLPVFRRTPWLKLPLDSVSVVETPFTVTLAVADVSSMLPDTVNDLLLSTKPSEGLVSVTSGATVSASTVRVVLSLLVL